MKFGKDPPPLPMYEPVKLKHVPTFVRRRYDKSHACNLNHTHTDAEHQDLPTYASGNEDDADEIDVCYPHDTDESVEDEHELLSNEQDSASEDNSKNGSQFEMEHPDHTEITNVEDEVHLSGYESSVNEHGVPDHCRGEDNSLSRDMEVDLANDFLQSVEVNFINEDNKGAISKDVGDKSSPDDSDCGVVVDHCKGEDYSLNCDVEVVVADDFLQRAEVNSTNEDNTGASIKDVGYRFLSSDGHLSPEVDAIHLPDDCGYSVLVNHCKVEDDSLSRDVKADMADDFRRSADVSSIHEDGTGALSKDVGNRCLLPTDSRSEDNWHEDGRNSVVTEACDLDSNRGNEAQDKEDAGFDNEHDSPKELSDSEGDGTEEVNPAFRVDYSCEDKENEHTDNQQVIQTQKKTEACGADDNTITTCLDQVIKGNGDGAEDTNLHESTVSCPVDVLIKDEVQDEALKLIDNEQDFNPKSNKEGLDSEDEYQLCCPICKQCITKTIIFQRRENDEHYRTTCFSWFTSQFFCIR